VFQLFKTMSADQNTSNKKTDTELEKLYKEVAAP